MGDWVVWPGAVAALGWAALCCCCVLEDIAAAAKPGGKYREEFLLARERHLELLRESGGKCSRTNIVDKKVMQQFRTEIEVGRSVLSLSVCDCALGRLALSPWPMAPLAH